MVSALLLFSVLVRMVAGALPEKDPPGVEEFIRECQLLSDSLRRAGENSRWGPHTGLAAGTRLRHPSVPQGEPIDLNRADSAGFLPLPGIGPVLAGRIVKYRNLLGGYYSVDQLQEVYGLSPETLDRIRNRLKADGTALRRIDLDTAGFRELLRHPYLDMEQVKAFVRYREFAGSPVVAEKLRENHIWPDSVIKRLSPYLSPGVD